MVIGNGLLAKKFYSYNTSDSYIVFASGVSNSGNKLKSEFNREKDLLLNTIANNPGKTIIYFGTCSVYDTMLSSSLYVLHKLAMEELIAKQAGNYHIFRISNLAGKTENPNTVLNYFAQHILNQSPFSLWTNSSRNIIDIDDAFLVCDYIIQNALFTNEIVNIANPDNYPVSDIVAVLETHFNQKGNYSLVEKESNPVIDTSAIKGIIAKLNINFDSNYLPRTIEKYFPVK